MTVEKQSCNSPVTCAMAMLRQQSGLSPGTTTALRRNLKDHTCITGAALGGGAVEIAIGIENQAARRIGPVDANEIVE